MVGRPRLVLADEPTAALDEESGANVVALFREFAHQHGSTILIVTHDEKILDAADRIVNMRSGRIISNVDIDEAVDLCEYLRGCPAFADLPPDVLARVADQMEPKTYPAGRPVVVQGDEGDKFYVIRSGEADVFIHDGAVSRHVRTLGPGDFFGEAALLLDQPRSATVAARTELVVFALGKDHFRAAVASTPSFKDRLLRTYFQRQ
jgi:putative ABC transport system ATP-binding protein